jgi:hypothetical protein
MKKKVEHANKVKLKRKEAPVAKTEPNKKVKMNRICVAKHEAAPNYAMDERKVKRESFFVRGYNYGIVK